MSGRLNLGSQTPLFTFANESPTPKWEFSKGLYKCQTPQDANIWSLELSPLSAVPVEQTIPHQVALMEILTRRLLLETLCSPLEPSRVVTVAATLTCVSRLSADQGPKYHSGGKIFFFTRQVIADGALKCRMASHLAAVRPA